MLKKLEDTNMSKTSLSAGCVDKSRQALKEVYLFFQTTWELLSPFYNNPKWGKWELIKAGGIESNYCMCKQELMAKVLSEYEQLVLLVLYKDAEIRGSCFSKGWSFDENEKIKLIIQQNSYKLFHHE